MVYLKEKRMIHFKESEFTMGGENVFDKMDPKFLILLDELREDYGHPLTITSSYRSATYNASIGGAKHSQHLLGKACDLACTDSTLRAVLVHDALDLGLTVGVGKTFVHVDSRDKQIMFTY